MEKLEKDVPVLICKMEKNFPPGFFNPMQHLLVHLAYEAKVGGPVQFRWMFHIERALKYLRAMVGNKVRVEGCIAEAFILKEISYFSSVYFAEKHNVNAPTMRYNVDEEPSASDLPIFQSTGASASASSPYYFKPGERVSAYLYMYANMKEMDPYFKEFQRQNWTSKKQPRSKQLDKMRRDGIDGKPNFPDWFKIYKLTVKSIKTWFIYQRGGCPLEGTVGTMSMDSAFALPHLKPLVL
ncbi:hypothetical protein U9M48_014079 [Paspalum notatum var. saurae]|uniref:DUF4218 domain-containing protein n=1 Tax=Paspalum notatum var. saurae TaxID=547442 RepID=A0AAQ3T3J0_PASNO